MCVCECVRACVCVCVCVCGVCGGILLMNGSYCESLNDDQNNSFLTTTT